MELRLEHVAVIRRMLGEGLEPCAISERLPELDEKDVFRVTTVLEKKPEETDKKVLKLAQFMAQWAAMASVGG